MDEADILQNNSIGKLIYNYYAKCLKVLEPNLYALLIDLGFGTHKRINIRLHELDYKKEDSEKILEFANKFMQNHESKIMYFSFDPDSEDYMTGVIKSHNGIFNLNKLLVDNGLMYIKEFN